MSAANKDVIVKAAAGMRMVDGKIVIIPADSPDVVEAEKPKMVDAKGNESRVLTASDIKALKAVKDAPESLVILNGDEVEPELISWLWPDRVALGKLTLFAGLPGEAKSLCTIDLAATLSKGRAVFGDGTINSLPPCDTLFLTTEDEVGDTQLPRFMLAGGDRKRVHWVKSKRGPRTDKKGKPSIVDQLIGLDEDLPLIEKTLKENPHIRLLVIDPLSGHLGKVPMNKDQEVREVLNELKEMASRVNVAVIFVLHLNKKADLDALQRVSGASAFVAVVRSSWLFTTDEEDEELRRMLSLKNNNIKRADAGVEFRLESTPMAIQEKTGYFPVISWLGKTDSKANAALSVKRGGGEKKIDGAEVMLRLALKNGPKPYEEIEKEAIERGFSKSTVDRAKAKLKIRCEKEQGVVDGRWFWSLPPTLE